jgi:hypothetical protein
VRRIDHDVAALEAIIADSVTNYQRVALLGIYDMLTERGLPVCFPEIAYSMSGLEPVSLTVKKTYKYNRNSEDCSCGFSDALWTAVHLPPSVAVSEFQAPQRAAS